VHTRTAAGIAAIAVVAACSGSDTATSPTDALDGSIKQCQDVGINFETTMATCDAAIARGREMAVVDYGVSTDITADSAGTTYLVLCLALQGDDPRTASQQSTLDMAADLNAEGVCPGDLSRLTLDPL
jgi:hypothetical protein